MAIDLTPFYWDLVIASGRANGLDDEGLRKLRTNQLLRSLGSKNDFTKATAEVAQNIASLKAFLRENQQAYVHAGHLRESERDQIEEQVGAYVRACSSNIERLQSMLKTIPTSSPAKAVPASADLLAHRQGSVLILSERLGALTSAFDRLRSVRYKQLQQEEANRKRRTPQNISAASAKTGGRTVGSRVRAACDAAACDIMNGGGGGYKSTVQQPAPQQIQQQQQRVDAENLALQAELLSLTDQVQHTERTVREIATLNSMFSTAILHQSDQIEKLYHEAVAATVNIDKANVQLDKAVRTNRSAQKCMFILLLMASLALLFLDWWYS